MGIQEHGVMVMAYVDKSKGMGKSITDNMQRRGYDACRISPAVTTKFGLKYRKVYGTQVEPNHRMSNNYGKKNKKFYPKIQWHLQGYIKAGKKKGTFILNRSILRDFQKTPLRS